MAAGLAQGQQPHLRERPRSAATAGTAESPFIGGGIGHIQHETIQGHRAHPAVERSGGIGPSEQSNQLLGQHPQRRNSQPLACLAQRRASRHRARTKRLQPTENLPIAVATAQPQRDHEPEHEPARRALAQRSVVAGLRQRLFHTGWRDDTLQSAESLGRGPRRQRVRLSVKIDHRSLLIRLNF